MDWLRRGSARDSPRSRPSGTLKPRGIAVLIEAEHMCMSMRGVQKQGASTVTTRFTGVFRDDPAEQVRFMSMVRGLK